MVKTRSLYRCCLTTFSARQKSRSIREGAGQCAIFDSSLCPVDDVAISGGQMPVRFAGTARVVSASGLQVPAKKSSMVRFQNHSSRQSSANGCWSQKSLLMKSSRRVLRYGRSPCPKIQNELRILPELYSTCIVRVRNLY